MPLGKRETFLATFFSFIPFDCTTLFVGYIWCCLFWGEKIELKVWPFLHEEKLIKGCIDKDFALWYARYSLFRHSLFKKY